MSAIFGETEPANGLSEEIPQSSLRGDFCRDPSIWENDNKHRFLYLRRKHASDADS